MFDTLTLISSSNDILYVKTSTYDYVYISSNIYLESMQHTRTCNNATHARHTYCILMTPRVVLGNINISSCAGVNTKRSARAALSLYLCAWFAP